MSDPARTPCPCSSSPPPWPRPQRLSWDYHCPSNNGLYSKDIDKEACRSPVLFFSCIGKFTVTFETRSFRGTVFSLGFPMSFDIRCIRSVLITYLYMFNIAMTRLIVILVKVLHSYEKYSDLLSAEHYIWWVQIKSPRIKHTEYKPMQICKSCTFSCIM